MAAKRSTASVLTALLLGAGLACEVIQPIEWPEPSTREAREEICGHLAKEKQNACALYLLNRDIALLKSKQACEASRSRKVCAALRAEFEMRGAP